MSFKKKKGYFKFLETHLKNPEIQSYIDLVSNFGYPHKTIFKNSKSESLYESILFAFLEQQIISMNYSGLDLMLSLIDTDISEILEWSYWKIHKQNIKTLILRLKDKIISLKNNSQENLNYLYNLKNDKWDFVLSEPVLPFQFYLNILMRYIIITHIIIKKDFYFANIEVLKKFLTDTKIYSLQQGFSEIALGFLPRIFSINFKIFCWEKKDENNNNLYLKKKYFITQDEKWKELSTISLIQNEDMLTYRLLPGKENELFFYKKVIEDYCLKYNDLIKSIVKYYTEYVGIGVAYLKNEFDIFKSDQKKTDPFELLVFENHNLDEVNTAYTQLKNMNSNLKIDNVNFSIVIDDFVFEKTNQIEKNLKELHTYIKKINEYNSYKVFDGKIGGVSNNPINKTINTNVSNYHVYQNPPLSEKAKYYYQEYNFKEKPQEIYKNFNFNEKEIPQKKEETNKIFEKNNPKSFEEQKFIDSGKTHYDPPPSIKKKFCCPICSSDVFIDESLITLDCDHKICKECLEGWLMAKYDLGQWDLENFKCFIPECSKTIDIHILKHIIGNEKFTKMCDKLVEKLCMNCPYLDCKMFFVNEMKNSPKIICPKCNRPICPKCNEKFHDSKACPKLFNIALTALKNEKLNVCPECFEVYLKDDKCAHVKCMKCSTEFCFECSCLRIPTLTHGNHYHRKDCKFFFPKEDPKTKKQIINDEFDPTKCSLCKESGKPCKRPISYKEFYNKFIKEKK